MLIVKSPLRISLGGGGTDIPAYFKSFNSFFISAAIDKYVYISINDIPEPHYFIRYSSNEVVKTIDEIQHKLIREALKIYNIGPGIEITSFADLPAGTGLGSSGSFLTALLKALDLYTGLKKSKIDISKTASKIEIDILKEPVGLQDTLISSIGGLTSFEITKDFDITFDSHFVSNKIIDDLFEMVYLIDTKKRRSASKEIKKTIQNKIDSKSLIQNLHNIKEVGYSTKEILQKGDLKSLGNLITQQWKLKLERSPSVFHGNVDKTINRLNNLGAYGSKLIGAGGGGYILTLIPHDRTKDIINNLNSKNMTLMPISLDKFGVREY